MSEYDLRTKKALRQVTLLEYGFGPETMKRRKICPECGRANGAQSKHSPALTLNIAEDTYFPHLGQWLNSHLPSVSHAISSAASSVSARMGLVTQHSSPLMSQ